MAPQKRSMLQLDLKNVINNKSTSALQRINSLSKSAAIFIILVILAIFVVLKFDLLSRSERSPLEIKNAAVVPTSPEDAPVNVNEDRKPLITLLPDTPAVTNLENASADNSTASNSEVQQTNERASQANDSATNAVETLNAAAPTLSDAKKYLTEIADQPWVTATVKKNDTLSQIFKRSGVGIVQSYKIAELEGAEPLLKIKPGEQIQFKRTSDEALLALRYQINQFDTLTVFKKEDEFAVELESRQPQIRLNSVKATIWSSLLETAESADISFNTMYDFITLFGWQIDFAKDIRSGDQFSIIFEELYLDGEKISNGNIIAAEMIASKKQLRAIRHVDDDGNAEFYAPNGDGVKGSFLRTPIKFGRVTSKFSNRRLHPIKKTWRAHKGVDYGAPRGTPILATGDGVVQHAGRKGGYGKTVIIRHGGKYDTLYAHLDKTAKNVSKGNRVKQGQVIGYVGSTGLATGPHLHYEFRIHGVHKNPLTVELPKSSSIPKKYKPSFLKIANIWSDKLDELANSAPVENSSDEQT